MVVLNKHITAGNGVVYAELDNEAVLLNVTTGMYFGLDAIGTRIWALVVSGTSHEQIVEALLAGYDVPRDVLESDVTEFLSDLNAHGLVGPGEA